MKDKLKKIIIDMAVDIAGCLAAALGIICFASSMELPMTGVSGLAVLANKLWNLPIGITGLMLNIPIWLLTYKPLGKTFFKKSIKTVLVFTIMQDYVAPLFPVYTGDTILAVICAGVLTGAGYGIIFLNESSTAGQDFLTIALRSKYPHISIGVINFILDTSVIIAGALVYKNFDGLIYGVLISFICSTVINKIQDGMDEGKLLLIITSKQSEIFHMIDDLTERGSTYIHAEGAYSGEPKKIVMCALSKKQAYMVRRRVKDVDPFAFTIIMNSNAVVGEGFKQE